MIEDKFIPDIKETTEVVRNVMKGLADASERLTSQIKSQLIPDAKSSIKAVEDTMNNLKKESHIVAQDMHEGFVPKATETMDMIKRFADSGQKLIDQIKAKLIPDAETTINAMENTIIELKHDSKLLTKDVYESVIPQATETMDIFKKGIEEIVNTMKALNETVVGETLPAVNETLTVVKDVMTEVARTSHIIGVGISQASYQIQIGLEIGIIILLFALAAYCRYELRMIDHLPELNIFHRIENMVLRLLRFACISYGTMRLIFIIILKQAEPGIRDVLFITFVPVLLCLLFDAFKQSNWKSSCHGVLQHMGNYAGSLVDFIKEKSFHLFSYLKDLKKWCVHTMRYIIPYIQKILRDMCSVLVVGINTENVQSSMINWPQKLMFLKFKQ